MQRESIHEEYSYDGRCRFIVCRKSDYFEVWVQKKIIDEYLNPDEIYFSDIPDIKHIADSLERAIEIGRECLNNLFPEPQQETCRIIELNGTKRERIAEAFRLAYTDVSARELEHFREVYEKVGIRLLPAAEKLYEQYGGVFRNYYLELDEPKYNNDIFLLFYSDLGDTRWSNEMERRFEEAMFDIDIVREFAGQEVCPVGDIGFYYPPIVYIGEDGRLYCVYEYKEEIDVFAAPEEIIADQLSNHMPVALKERKTG
ncbi:MAG: hypothetical protein IKD66_03330 [Solobacterium sp.]|nr:hypothetical protein [Solobacterium sp.]